jgi:hypothetical protein
MAFSVRIVLPAANSEASLARGVAPGANDVTVGKLRRARIYSLLCEPLVDLVERGDCRGFRLSELCLFGLAYRKPESHQGIARSSEGPMAIPKTRTLGNTSEVLLRCLFLLRKKERNDERL